MPGQNRTLGTRNKLITLLDVLEQAFGSYIDHNFHSCCKGSLKLSNGLMEMDVFGQLLISAGKIETVVTCDDFFLYCSGLRFSDLIFLF